MCDLAIGPMIKVHTFVAIMPYFRLTVKPKMEIARLDCGCEPVLLCSSMRDLEGLLMSMTVFEQGENHEAIPNVIGLEFEPEWPISWWGVVF
jgi:hypothetical protein